MHSTRQNVMAALTVVLLTSAQMLPESAQAASEVHVWTIPAASDDPMPQPLPMRTNTKYAHRVLSAALKDNSPSAVTDVTPNSQQQVAIVQGKLDSPAGGLYSLALGIDKSRTEWPSGTAFSPTLSITNIGFSDLIYSETGQGALWQIATPDDHVVYDSARGKIIPHFRLRHRLAPGQSQVFTAPVTLKDNQGHLLPPGQYILRGRPGAGLGVSVETKITVDPPAQP